MASLKITVLFLITILFYNTPPSFTLQIGSLYVPDYLLNLHPLIRIADQQAVKQTNSFSNYKFATNLTSIIVRGKITENIVFSPASIFTSLALILLGAEGRTAKEIATVLNVDEADKRVFASKYGEISKATFNNAEDNDQAPQLSMAIRLYVANKLKILDSFNQAAQENFNCLAENVNFGQPRMAVGKMNNWVEQETKGRIRNLLKPNDVNNQTSAVLVNAIHFKAEWLYPFSKHDTKKSVFYISSNKKTKVEMMYQKASIRYAELKHLNAVAIEMPYKKTTSSMLIILPNRVGGLQKLENKLKRIDLNGIIKQMVVQSVRIYLPKFRIESEIDLKKPLKEMGISSIFGNKAELTGIFENAEPQKISEVKQKAFFDCNEGGSEAAASTFMKIEGRSFNPHEKIFSAKHPFIFFVLNKNTVLFSGHVTMG